MYATTHHQYVLQLDIQGTPQAWLSIEEAATYVATESVAWTNGDGPLATLRGGFNVRSGRMSTIEVYPIIALHGSARVNLFDRIPTYSRHKLCRRDRFMCAYCGDVRPERELSADHIVPQAQGGRWCWTNAGICRSGSGPLLQVPDLVDRQLQAARETVRLQLAHDDDQFVVLEQVAVGVDQRLVGAGVDDTPTCRPA
jgi:hypothetical protein